MEHKHTANCLSKQTCGEDLYPEILTLREMGLNQTEIGIRLSLSQGQVSLILRKHGHVGVHHPSIHLSYEQKQILVGTVLGDGCIQISKGMRYPYLGFNHGWDQADYLLYKANKLGCLFESLELKEAKTAYLTSKSSPILLTWQDLFYGSGKKAVSDEVLTGVDQQALAIWFGDDGTSWYGDGETKTSLGMVLGGLTELDYKRIVDWFEQKWHLKTSVYSRESNCIVVAFVGGTSERFAGMIKPFLPDVMKYKLGKWND